MKFGPLSGSLRLSAAAVRRGRRRCFVLDHRSLSSIQDSGRERTVVQRREDHAHCVNLVRERDREGYLCGLLMPAASRKAYFAIRAFNVELASIKDGHYARRAGQLGGPQVNSTITTNTLALQMRMQWWREAIHAIYKGRGTKEGDDGITDENIRGDNSPLSNISVSCWHNPVVRELDQAHKEFDLTRRFLERLIDAREMDLEVNQYAKLEQLVGYAEESFSSLLYLSLECTGVREDSADVVASHAGVGIGLATSLRSTTFRLLQGEVAIPADLLPLDFPYHQLMSLYHRDVDGDNEEDDDGHTLDETAEQQLREAVHEMAHLASSHLAQARELQGQVPSQGRPCILPVVPAIHFLYQLEQANYQLTEVHKMVQNQQESPAHRLRLLWLLSRTWLTGIF